ncbi:TonB-dependent receptor domain-containing protein [Hymenobacter caeli]|uniref:Outer membrane receptor protein involved in Fe transport n=1 Tax=Hymenobacter caeli TaxID=2735894 RepID=A0ABX2FTL1_9BACT|nr:TonB-dependent receptor [Hymenobacter caeli]NRT20178.1 outer membrane receptor protein involved in Fe transport [Hymenobacter caeli]
MRFFTDYLKRGGVAALFFFVGLAGARAQTGSVRGTLLDAATQQPVPFADVILRRAGADSALVAGAQTTATGAFALERLPLGAYSLRALAVGYRPARMAVALTAAAPALQLGPLRVRAAATQLKGVVVTAERPAVSNSLDKLVVDVSKDLTATGGTAIDALQNVPSVTVDQTGAVSLRGSTNVQIFVDGKPTNTTLDQIPASSIQSIEVVTNPSARYDAAGSAGLLNIVLKKDRRDGLNGQAAVNVGTQDKYSTSLGLNYHRGRLNAFGSYDFRQDRRTSYGTLDQTTTFAPTDPATGLPGAPQTLLLHQDRSGVAYQTSHAVRLGLDFELTPTQTLTLAVQPRFNRQAGADQLLSRQQNTADGRPVLLGTNDRANTNQGHSRSADATLDYRRTWGDAQPGRELTASATYAPAQNDNETSARIRYLPNDSATTQQQRPTNRLLQAAAQVDYVHPLGEKSRLETGLRSTLNRYDLDYFFRSATPLRFDPSNRFVYTQHVQAAYATYAGARGKLRYQGGVRAELTNQAGDQQTTGEQSARHYLDLFPSAVLAYDFTADRQVRLSYSRRIQRPDAGELNPFPDRSDQLNLVTGNPLLLPEYVQAFELGHQQTFASGTSLSFNGFYRLESNTAQGFRQVITDPLTGYVVTNTTRLNLGTEYTAGLEVVGATALTSFWKLNGNASTFRRIIKGSGAGTAINTSAQVYTARLNTVLTPVKKLDLQLALNYRSPVNTPQGQRLASFNVDAAAKYTVLHERGTITLRATDLFNTLRFGFDTYSPGLTAFNRFKRESRIGFLGFSYRFGQAQAGKPKKNEQPDEAGGGFE